MMAQPMALQKRQTPAQPTTLQEFQTPVQSRQRQTPAQPMALQTRQTPAQPKMQCQWTGRRMIWWLGRPKNQQES